MKIHPHSGGKELSLLFKYAVTTLSEDSKPIVNDILQFIVPVYRECPQPSILEVTKTLVILFGHSHEYRTLNQQLLCELVNTTLQMCAQLNTNNQLSEKTDVLDSFFNTLAALLKKVPQLLLSSGVDIGALFQCAILCLTLSETSTLKACSSFLVHFIELSRESSQVEVVQTYGESLVLRILINIGSTAPRSSVDTFSDILHVLNKKYCDNLSRWLNSLLAQEGFPSPRVSDQQKKAFIKAVLKEKANKRKLADSVLEFTLFCRGILKHDASCL